MKRFISANLLALALFALCSSASAADLKIATVDFQKVFVTSSILHPLSSPPLSPQTGLDKN